MVSTEQLQELDQMNIKYDVLINDVEEHLREGQRDLELSRAQAPVCIVSFIFYLFYCVYSFVFM